MDQQTFKNQLAGQTLPVIVYFWAPWCFPCRIISPAVEKIKKTYADEVEVWKLNADDHPQLLKDLAIYGIPTLIAFKQGVEIERQIGAMNANHLDAWIHMLLTGEQPKTSGIRTAERLLRIGAGIVLASAGLVIEPGWLLFLAGGLVAFTGVYDRCPIWQAIRARLFHQAG